MIWTKANGVQVEISDMDDEHLHNTICFLARRLESLKAAKTHKGLTWNASHVLAKNEEATVDQLNVMCLEQQKRNEVKAAEIEKARKAELREIKCRAKALGLKVAFVSCGKKG